MNGNFETPANQAALLETFAAQLTVAAYRVALRMRPGENWLDLELDLWTALAKTVEAWGKEFLDAASR